MRDTGYHYVSTLRKTSDKDEENPLPVHETLLAKYTD